MLQEALQRLSTEHDIRRAIDRDWLRLHYQPIVNLHDGRIVGAEALLRIAHPERGLLYLSALIEVAEDGDLIEEIGDWVLQEACHQLARWHPTGSFRMAINISGRELSKLAVTGRILSAAAQAGVEPSRLSLEMTEGVLIEGSGSVIRELRHLTDEGVNLAIDDFGTGYGSLTYLQQFPVDIKIDRSFVAGLGVRRHVTAIVEAVTALSHSLNLVAVAEGVETAEQLTALRALGCPLAQGFHFWRALPPDELAALLVTKTRAIIPETARR